MYLAGILIFIVVSIWVVLSSVGNIAYFVDLYSILSIVLLVVPMLAAAGAFKDFNRAFRYVVNKKAGPSNMELIRAVNSVNMTRKLIMLSGLLVSLIGLIAMQRQLDDPSLIGPYVSVAMISAAYAIILNIILLPIECRLKNMVSENKEQ